MDINQLKANVFPGESGGDYNALFGYSNRPSGQFEGVNLTNMTVNEALQFASLSGPYAQWVKGQVGRVATPMGAYQVVGTTLSSAKEGLGLTGNERMTPELQDQIGQWIYQAQGPGAWEAWGKGGSGGNMQRPTGLLGAPTVSTRGQMPEQPQEKLPFFQRPGVGNFFDTLAMGLEGMTLNPNQGLVEAAQERIQQRRETAQTAQQRNRTVEVLKQMRADPQLIQLAEAGYADEALKEAIRMRQGAEPTKGVEIGDRLVNPITGEVIADFASDKPQYDPKDVADARKEFTGLKPVKDFAEQTSAYGRVLSSIEDPSAAGDLSLIFNYMKVLDPGSTVREGEFATAQNAGGIDQRVRGLFNRIMSGERLSPEQRADFADRATRLYQGAEQQYQSLAQQYASFAEASGLPVEQVIPDFGYSGDRYQTPIEFQRPPPPAGITADDWAVAWSNMSDEERSQFINGGQ